MADEPRWDDIFASQPAGSQPDGSGAPTAPVSRKEARQAENSRSSSRRGASAPRPKVPRQARESRRRKSRAWIGWLVSVVVVLGLAGGGAAYAWMNFEPQIRKVMGWELPPPDYEGQGTGEATVVIYSGDTGAEVTDALLKAGVIKDFDTFYTLLLEQEPPVQFFPGYYVLAQKMSSVEALKALQDPNNRVENTALIQEGRSADQVFDILNAATGVSVSDFEAAAKDLAGLGLPADAPNIEGYLFPATYHFDPGVDAASVLRILVDRTFQALDSAGVAPEDRARVLTIASLIQREAGTNPEDFFKVSRVIQNRLAEGMKLQFDSTAHYGYTWKHGEREDGGVFSSSAELADDNPYNTYVITGLPQGPIGAAGDLAIDAALHPADGPWLYFVTVNLDTGETVFTSTNAEHNAAVRQLQDWCRTTQSPNCD